MEMKNFTAYDFRMESKEYDVYTLLKLISDGTVRLDESSSTWSATYRSHYIESILLGVPPSDVCIDKVTEKHLVVVDGNERLLAIKKYVDGDFALENLAIYEEDFKGFTFDKLPNYVKRKFYNAVIKVRYIYGSTTDPVRKILYNWINPKAATRYIERNQ